MELINHTPFVAESTTALDVAGRKQLLVVVKATYRLPLGGEAAQLAQEQLPLVLADTATGEPGMSAPEYESDFALFKPQCDVLLLGSAYAPQGIETDRVGVGLKIGSINKAFYVLGPRQWRAGWAGVRRGPAAPFKRQPISYDIAFGGMENNPEHPDKRAAYLPNPIGIGFQKQMKHRWIDGAPMPQTECAGAPVTSPRGRYVPMGFGPIGRNWPPRVKYAGTYDKRWETTVFPFLPADFDNRYYQCAPLDQQLAELKGGEKVTLFNLTHPALTPNGRLEFLLPDLTLLVSAHTKEGTELSQQARADTLILEPDRQRFTITWRAAWPLQRTLDEIDHLEVGALAEEEAATAFCRVPDERDDT